MARQLVQDFGDRVQVVYHDLSRPGAAAPEEVRRRIENEHLPYPVTAVDGEIVSSGDVSYFVLADRIKQTASPAH